MRQLPADLSATPFPATQRFCLWFNPAPPRRLPPQPLFLPQPRKSTLDRVSPSASRLPPQQGLRPTGNVTLLDGSASLGASGLTSGAATFTIASLAAGTHSITASYAGDTADGASISSAVSVQVNASTAPLQATVVTLTATPTTAVSGEAITLTAKVAETAGRSSPAGTVTFQDGSSAIGSSPLAAGSGTLAVNTLSVGTHSLTAVYGGDTANSPSASKTVSVTITAASAPPPTPAADYGLTLSSGALTVAQGTPGSLTVSVAPDNGFSASLSFACSGLPADGDAHLRPPCCRGLRRKAQR
jgi:Bacterial Ig-like domain (group 3)